MKKVLLTTLALILTVFAFWPAGGVKVVETPDEIENPQMVYINDGSVIISWEAGLHIYCQKLDTTGVIHWDAEGVRVCLSDSAQRDHHMVTDGQDVWFVWQDERTDDGDIYAQKINGTSGQRLWGDQGKGVCVKEGTQRLQTCTVLPNGSFIATWGDYSIDPRDVAAQWFDSNGQALWEPSGIYVTRSTGGGYKPITLPSGEAMLDVWLGVRTGDTVGAYFAQRVDTNGDFLWNTQGVLVEYISTPYSECSDGLGGAVVLFSNPGYLGVQRIDSSGNVVWTPGGVKIAEFALNNSASLQLPYPSPNWIGIVTDSAGGCFIWQNFYAQHIDASGSLIWGSGGVTYWNSDGVTYRIGAARLCSDGNKGLMVLFDNLEWDSPDWPPYKDQGVRIQRIDSGGQTKFDTNGIIIRLWNYDSLPGYESFSLTSSAIPGGVIAAWWDNRNEPDYSIYAQIVDTTGKVGSGIMEESFSHALKPSLEVNMVLNSSLVSLRYSLPYGEIGILKLFDVSGSLIRSQRVTQPERIITWNATNFPSGVYFAQLVTSNNSRVSCKLLILR